MTYQEISNFIWNIADDVLRGFFKNHEYGDVILPFVVLRRLDCMLEPHKKEVYKLSEQYKGKIENVAPVITGAIGKKFYNKSQFDLQGLKVEIIHCRKRTMALE